ncbi:MAG: hypothetical protein PHG48_07635 [Eubacteriales bacterium]|nr:hypothetical protein [Eubacteriales bacterium]
MNRIITTTSTGNGEEVRIAGIKDRDPKPGDEVTIVQSFSGPPALSYTTYRITRRDETGTYGVQTGYVLDEMGIADVM